MKTNWRWLIGAGLAMASAPVAADNPRVTTAMRGVTAAEAVAALARASKIPLRIFIDSDPAAAVPANPVRGTFNWRDTPFSTALREVCAKYSLQPGRTMGGGYQLAPQFQAAPPPAGVVKRVGLVEKGNISLHIAATRVGINRMLRFDGAGDDVDDSHLAVEFVGRVKEGDADSIAGLRSVVATDDLGNKLVANIGEGDRNVFSPSYPDEWAGHLLFQAPHPRARKLVSIRGEVLHYRINKTVRFEVALPAKGKTITFEQDDVLARVVSFDPDPKQIPGDPGEDGPPVGAILKVQLGSRSQEPVAPLDDPSSIAPILMDDQGNSHEPILFNANHQGPDGLLEMDCSYPRLKGKAVKALFCVTRKSQPERLFAFEMRDIPLPGEKPFVAQRVPVPSPQSGALEGTDDHPFYQRDGGTLVQKVVLPAGIREGVLAVGLSPQRGAEWGPIRWTNVSLEEGGLARLSALKPGKYRVRRTFRPAEGQTLPATGKWEGTEVEVLITAGKEINAVPLQWRPATPSKPGRSGENVKGRKGANGKGK